MENTHEDSFQHDRNFEGPGRNRSCTNVVWLILFIMFLGVWGSAGYFGMKHVSIQALLGPVDSNGLHCGVYPGLEEKKYLVLFNIANCLSPGTPITGCPTTQVCVNQCPNETIFFKSKMTAKNFAQFKSRMVCLDGVNIDNLNYNQAITHMHNNICANYVLQSQPVLGRCFWNESEMKVLEQRKALNLSKSQITSLSVFVNLVNNNHVLAQIIQDLIHLRWYLGGALMSVVLICFIYMLLLRWIVVPVVWTSIVGFLGLIVLCLYLCYENYKYYNGHPVQDPSIDSLFNDAVTWLVLLILAAVMLLILLLIVVFLRDRIFMAATLLQEGSKAITAVKLTVFLPIIPWTIQCLVFAYGVMIYIYLLSTKVFTFNVTNLEKDTACNCKEIYVYDGQACEPITFAEDCQDLKTGGACQHATCHYTGLESVNVFYLNLANLLAFVWTTSFISGVTDMMLAGTYSAWYWTSHKKNLPLFTLPSGIYITLRYHLGTVALGSFLIPVVRVIRVVMDCVNRNIRVIDNFIQCTMCCCKCYFWCMDNLLQFTNKNVYIMCAVHGHGFCKSARDASYLLKRNIGRVIILDQVTGFVLCLSKLLISIGVGLAMFYVLQLNFATGETQGETLHYIHVPAIILSIATYLLCTIFFNVHEIAVDTLFLCFLEDCDKNDGSAEKPYFMTKNLMKILGKENRKL